MKIAPGDEGFSQTLASGGGVGVGPTAPGGGAPIETIDDGSSVVPETESYDFVGAGVSVSAVGNAVTVTIPGTAGAAGGDLSGTYPNPSVVDDSHAHTAATLPATHWEPVIFDNAGTPEIVFFQDAGGVWDIVMAEVSN